MNEEKLKLHENTTEMNRRNEGNTVGKREEREVERGGGTKSRTGK